MKYLVLDLDGTLLNDSKQISKEDAEAISALSDDCGLIFASGRHFSEISNYLKIFKRKPSFVICCDGVNTYDENGKRIGNRQTTLNEDDFKALLEIVKKGSILIICDSKNMVFRDNLLSRARRLFKNNKTERYIVGNKLNAEKMRIRKKYVDKNTFESLRKFFSVHIVFNCFADVKRKGVSKYSAIKMICELNGVNEDSIYYFGDDMNDIECFDNLKHCVAMDNACEDIKSKAEFITKSNNESGVAYAMRNYLHLIN